MKNQFLGGKTHLSEGPLRSVAAPELVCTPTVRCSHMWDRLHLKPSPG